jgi:integrase
MPSTMASYVSHLRAFCSMVEKPSLIEAVDQYCAERPALVRRKTAATRDKSERGSEVSIHEIIARACDLDERFACQLALIAAFGLRSQEAWLLRPHLVGGETGAVTITWGTKGGRPRTLPLAMTPEQRAVLEWAKTFAQTRHESMIPRGMKVQTWRRKYYGYCGRIGLTRRDAKVTPHSLRHGVLLNVYEKIAGFPATVRRAVDAAVDPFVDKVAREVVSEFAGHSRTSVSSAYLGPVRRRRLEGKGEDHWGDESPRSDEA